jgi:hypothetical protein
MLIYLLLDEINVPSDDPTRVSVFARNKTLRDVGEELMKGIAGGTSSPRYKYDENEPL